MYSFIYLFFHFGVLVGVVLVFFVCSFIHSLIYFGQQVVYVFIYLFVCLQPLQKGLDSISAGASQAVEAALMSQELPKGKLGQGVAAD